MTVPCGEAVADDVAGILADELGRPVEVDDSGGEPIRVSVWLDPAEWRGGNEAALYVENLVRSSLPGALIGRARAETEEETDWLAGWKNSLEPLPIGERLIIVPSWIEFPADPARIKITLDPGMAFGTGHHPTTAGCLSMLEKRGKGANALDVGCGSGILAIAAAKLGAKRVLGVDNNPETIPIARENVAKNAVVDRVEIMEGSLGSIEEKFEIVLANLYLGSLVKLAPGLYQRTAPGGFLIASGLREDQRAEADSAFRAAGFNPLEEAAAEGWVTLVYGKGKD